MFSRLTPSDKDAFFALLDEYFASRPELFENIGNGMNRESGAASAASTVQRAFSASPHEVASAVNGWKRPGSNAASSGSPEVPTSVGRVAAAAAALKLSTPDASSTGFPRPPPRRNPSSSNEESSYVQPEHNRLVPVKKFGDVDLSSGKNMYNSLRHSTANKTATPPPVAPPVPSAFPARKSFAPPPMRRVPSTVSVSDAVAPSPPPPIPSRARQEEEVNGEWAEAVYDYSSEDPGDLELQAEQRVLVVEKTSDDWWTGEIGGRRGLIPAAYVKIL